MEGFSSNWWKEFTEKYAIASPSSEGYPALPTVKHGKWYSSHHRLGENDHYIPQTDASLVPEWMYSTPLSSARYTPVVARPGREGMDRVIKVVMGPDGVVMYQVGEGQGPAKVHGGIGCVFRYVLSPPSSIPVLIPFVDRSNEWYNPSPLTNSSSSPRPPS